MADEVVPDLSFVSLRGLYRCHAEAARDVLRLVYERISSGPPAVWIHVTPFERAQAALSHLKFRLCAGEDLPLYGLPFAVKDNIDVEGMPTTAGCPGFSYMPARSAKIVDRLLSAGAICIGKTNMDQFATGLTGTRSPYGICASYFDNRYIAGGSSSGSAVAVAAAQVSFALGTDSGGSGRIPAAFNNVVGVKPTIGALSLDGTVPNARLFDCPSIFSTNVDDATELRRMLEGTNDRGGLRRRPLVDGHSEPAPLSGLRIAVPRPEDHAFFGCDASRESYETAVAAVAQGGGQIIEFDFTRFRAAGAMILQSAFVAERKAGIRTFFDERRDAFHPVVRKVFEQADGWSAVEAFEALYRMEAMRRDIEPFWSDADVVIVPSAPRPFLIQEILEAPMSRNADVGYYSYFVNVLDLCALAIPNGFLPTGMPTGLTLIGPAWADDYLAQIARHVGRGAGPLPHDLRPALRPVD